MKIIAMHSGSDGLHVALNDLESKFENKPSWGIQLAFIKQRGHLNGGLPKAVQCKTNKFLGKYE